ncbi:MAG: hypothetical protein L0H31_16855, partial [Nocardioidaceae bacterium]|nr:hypothetical protein [Nocardioidaceae bacterium]
MPTPWLGEELRDFTIDATTDTIFPYDGDGVAVDVRVSLSKYFWGLRTPLVERVDFGQRPTERGLRWFDHSMFFGGRYRVPRSLVFAFVATHNHFVLDRGGK